MSQNEAHPSGILTLSEAAKLKKWGGRTSLSQYFRDGILIGRRQGRYVWTTTFHLDSMIKPKKGPKAKDEK